MCIRKLLIGQIMTDKNDLSKLVVHNDESNDSGNL